MHVVRPLGESPTCHPRGLLDCLDLLSGRSHSSGANGRIRTVDLLFTKQLLYP